jgi:hypothetical protein
LVSAARLRREPLGRNVWTARHAIEQAEQVLAASTAPTDGADVRWSAIIWVAEFAETDPDELWAFALKWGSSPDADLRQAVASCLLEHLLEFHFATLFPKVAAAARTDSRFADTFIGCWEFGQTKEPTNAAQFHALKEELRAHA